MINHRYSRPLTRAERSRQNIRIAIIVAMAIASYIAAGFAAWPVVFGPAACRAPVSVLTLEA